MTATNSSNILLCLVFISIVKNTSPNLVPEHTVFPVIDILTPLIMNSPLVPLQCVVNGVEASRVHMFWTVEGKKIERTASFDTWERSCHSDL